MIVMHNDLFYTSYSFTKENEQKGFETIEKILEKYPLLRYKYKQNAHDFGSYRSIEIYHEDSREEDHDEYCDLINCLCDSKGLEQAQAFESEVQANEEMQLIL
jgi:hypothetical protein